MLHPSTPAFAPSRSSSRARRRLLGVVGPAVLVAAALATPAAPATAWVGPIVAAEVTDSPADAGCTDQQVTVVVDLTDLGGGLEVGCGDVPATGTEVLLDAGFVETRDPSGFICAINSLPDPCPTTFTGSFWSYWHGEPGGEWQAYDVGSDTSAPAAGQSEGWRYNDGSQGPGAAPAVADDEATTQESPHAEESASADETAPADQSATDDETETTEPTAAAADSSAAGPTPTALAGIGLVVVLALAGVIIAARRRSAASRGDGPADQD